MQVREGHASPLDERCFVHGLLDLGKVIGIMRMHGKSDAGARIAVYLELDEGGHAGDVDATGRKVSTRDGDGLDGLVDRPGANRLNTYGIPVLDESGNRAGNGAGEDLLETFRKSMSVSLVRVFFISTVFKLSARGL